MGLCRELVLGEIPSKLFLTNRLKLKLVIIIYKEHLSHHPLLAKISAQKHAFSH